jgi:site-specific recombinase XerD
MYEKLKNQFALSLSSIYSNEDIETILRKLDIVSYNYEIKQKETSITLYNYEMPEMVKIYLVCKKVEGLADGTLYNYGKTLENFFFQVRKTPDKISPNDIRVYLYHYQETKQISNRSLDKVRQVICGFFTWSNSEGYLERNPAITIKSIKYEKKERKPMSQIELEYIRQSCKTLREKAIVEFLYSTGCRVSELCCVKKSDIDWNSKSVHLFGKGKKHRTSYINAKAEVSLLAYLNTRNDDSEYLFVSERKPHGQLKKDAIEKVIRIIAQRASEYVDKPISPHVFRHTCASTALNNGMPIEDISCLLGHENISTTMIYSKISLDNVKNNHKKYVI